MTADLRTLLEQLNRARIIAGKQRVSFAEIARATGGSKSTVAAVVAGTYHAQTAAIHRMAIRRWITDQARSLQPPAAPRPRLRHRTRRTARVRAHTTGYLCFRDRTYYAGDAYAGALVEVHPLPGRDRAVRVTLGHASRVAWPIDPAGNQLGYTPQENRNANP